MSEFSQKLTSFKSLFRDTQQVLNMLNRPVSPGLPLTLLIKATKPYNEDQLREVELAYMRSILVPAKSVYSEENWEKIHNLCYYTFRTLLRLRRNVDDAIRVQNGETNKKVINANWHGIAQALPQFLLDYDEKRIQHAFTIIMNCSVALVDEFASNKEFCETLSNEFYKPLYTRLQQTVDLEANGEMIHQTEASSAA